MQNEAQYDLDGKAAKISVLSSNNLDRYEYLTGEYLGLKSSTIEQGRFENSPLGKIFNKGLDKDDPLSSNSESFTYKTSVTGNTYNIGDGEEGYDANKVGKNET